MMCPIIKTLQVLGFWSRPDYFYSPRRAILLILVVTVCLLIPEIGFIVQQEPDFSIAIRNLTEALIMGNFIPQATLILIHRPLLEQAYTELKTALREVSADPHKDVQAALKNQDKFSEWAFKIFLGMEAVIAVPYFLFVPITIIIKYLRTGVLPPLQGIFQADYLLFDYRSNFWSWIATCIVTYLVTLLLIFFLVSSNSFYWSFLNYIAGLFEIVSLKLWRLDEFSDDRLRREEWIEIVELQEVAYRCTRNMEEVLNIFMLILYGECILELCMTLASLTLATVDQDMLLKMIIVLIYNLLHIFIYSILGSNMISASTATADAIYASRWYRRSVDEQRNVLFALARTQQMASITTGKFFYVNRITFGMALQTALSYYAVLRQVFGSY